MKAKKFAVLVMVFALALTVSAFAGEKASGKATIRLSSAAQVNGTELAPGTYKVTWWENGNGLEVKLVPEGKKEGVTAKAKAVDTEKKHETGAVVTRANGSGKPAITEIRLAGKAKSLILEGAGASYSSSGN
jgi:hypothetical protein